MSLACPSMLEAVESSVEIMYECVEDMMRLLRVMILNIKVIPPSQALVVK